MRAVREAGRETEDRLEEDSGALASSSGGEQSGAGTPFPTHQEAELSWQCHPKLLSPVAVSSLFPTQDHVRVSSRMFIFMEAAVPSPPILSRTLLFIALMEAGCITVQFHARVVGEPRGSGQGWRL